MPHKFYSELSNIPKAIGPYSAASEANGLVFLSGQIPLNPSTMEMVSGGIEEQTKQVMSNIEAALTALDLKFSNVLKTTIFLTTMDNFQVVNKIYEEKLAGAKPARSTVAVAGLPRGCLIEIEMIAMR